MALRFASLLPAAVLLMTVCAQIRILSPDDVARDFAANHGVVYGTTATFGTPYYGERVLGQLVYGESKHGTSHCSKGDYELLMPGEPALGPKALPTAMRGKELVNVAVVWRGRCTFVTKVRIAAAKGAHAVIIVDRSNKSTDEIQRVVMADDGYGDDIRIPSMMISGPDGRQLMTAATNKRVIVELAWDIPRADVVVADFWMSAGSEESTQFLVRFQDAGESLRYHLEFVPHYHVFSLPSGVGQKEKLCFDKESRYCAPDPDGPGPVTGADVAKEDLRQLCLWHVTARPQSDAVRGAKYSKAFWEYVVLLASECPIKETDPDRRFGDRCANKVLEGLSVQTNDKVLECMRSNSEKYLEAEVRNTAWSAQALRVNGWRYSGPLDPELVLKAICHGFVQMPKECTELLERFGPFNWQPFLVSVRAMALSMLLLVALPVTACYFYRRFLAKSMHSQVREEVMLEVQSQIADYTPLQDSNARTLAF